MNTFSTSPRPWMKTHYMHSLPRFESDASRERQSGNWIKTVRTLTARFNLKSFGLFRERGAGYHSFAKIAAGVRRLHNNVLLFMADSCFGKSMCVQVVIVSYWYLIQQDNRSDWLGTVRKGRARRMDETKFKGKSGRSGEDTQRRS